MLIFLFFVITGVLLGALNPEQVHYDLGFIQLQLPSGVALLGVLAIGWLLGGLTAWLGMSRRHRRRILALKDLAEKGD